MIILAITQARIGSTRLPEKILKTINGESLLEIHLRRVLQSKMLTKLKVATTTEPDSDKINVVANKLGVEVYKGSTYNVLDRFYQTAIKEAPDWIVRLTSDCPLIDPVEIDNVVKRAITTDFDYVSNTLTPTFPDGIDVEVFKFTALEKAFNEAKLLSELEHVTPFIWKNSTFKNGNLFSSDCVMNEIDFSNYRLTVDTLEDYDVIKKLVELLGTNKSWMEYIEALKQYPEIKLLNDHNTRNEGYIKSINNDKIK